MTPVLALFLAGCADNVREDETSPPDLEPPTASQPVTPPDPEPVLPEPTLLERLQTDQGYWRFASAPTLDPRLQERFEARARLVFGDGWLSGYDGCNSFSSGYAIGEVDGGPSLESTEGFLSTEVGCSDAVLEVFERLWGAPISVGEDRLVFAHADGPTVFERVRPTPLAPPGGPLCEIEEGGSVQVPSPPNFTQPVRGDRQFSYPPGTARIRGFPGYQTSSGAELLDGEWVEFSKFDQGRKTTLVRVRRLTTTPTYVRFTTPPECEEMTVQERRKDFAVGPDHHFHLVHTAPRTDVRLDRLDWFIRPDPDGGYEGRDACGLFTGSWSLFEDRLDLSTPVRDEACETESPLDILFESSLDMHIDANWLRVSNGELTLNFRIEPGARATRYRRR